MHHCLTKVLPTLMAAAITLLPISPAFAHAGDGDDRGTAIKHLVVIFQENVSFDHYFGTYPNALNPAGEPGFRARHDTPTVNGLSQALLTNNPNLNPATGAGATNPFPLDRPQASPNRPGPGYRTEQTAFDHGRIHML